MKKIYLFAVIFALIAGFATYFFVNSLQHNSSITGVEEADVVVALQDIEPDTPVKPEMFQTIRIPVSGITYGTFSSVADIDGLVVKEKIFKGEQVMTSKLISTSDNINLKEYNDEYHLSYHLTNGNYAYTFKADTPDAVAFFVRKGDYINVYDSRINGAVLKNVKVLEIGTYSQHQASPDGSGTEQYELITVSLTEAQIARMMKVDDTHTDSDLFHVVLVPYTEGAAIPTTRANPVNNGTAQVREPVTNRGMGEITTTVPETTKAQ